MLLVLVGVALLVSIPLAVITTVAGQLPLTTNHLLWNDAYEAAQAGLSDYLQHLDADSSYTRYSSSDPDSSNPAFTGWVTVASSNPTESYEYAPTVLQGQYAGLVGLTVSGRAVLGGQRAIRTIAYRIRPATSLNTIYWTNYETLDGRLIGDNSDDCAVFQGQNGGPPSRCIVEFAPGDVLDGPVFSNDGFYMCDNTGTAPTFENTISSADAYASPNRWEEMCPGVNSGPDWPTSAPLGPSPLHVPNAPPQTTDAADLAAAQDYGCAITGGSGSVTFTLNGSTLTWTGGTLSNAASNPNAAAACGGSTGGGSVNFSALRSAVIYTSGNAVVSGPVTGSLTIVSGANITIDGPITYPSADKVEPSDGPWSDQSDALGLIAQNSIVVLHAGNGRQCSGMHPTNCDYTDGIEIDAALLALNQSFYIQNWAQGAMDGTLSVFGSIAQYHRGPVGTVGSSGYLKSYHYDSSLQTLWPPYFIPPQGAVWSAVSYSADPPGPGNEAVPGT